MKQPDPNQLGAAEVARIISRLRQLADRQRSEYDVETCDQAADTIEGLELKCAARQRALAEAMWALGENGKDRHE